MELASDSSSGDFEFGCLRRTLPEPVSKEPTGVLLWYSRSSSEDPER
jgi:hypothetical protein